MKAALKHQEIFFNSIASSYHSHSQQYLKGMLQFFDLTKKYVLGNVLDIGSGGIIAYDISKTKSLTLADISPKILDEIQYIKGRKLVNFRMKNVKKIVANVIKMPFKRKAFDTVIMVTTAHHLSEKDRNTSINNIKAAFVEIHRVLKPNGVFIIHECFPNILYKIFQELFFTNLFSLFAKIDKPLPYFLSEKQLQLYLSTNGYKIMRVKMIKTRGSTYIPLFPAIRLPGWIWDLIQPSKTYICRKM